jgi:hypothetical protein
MKANAMTTETMTTIEKVRDTAREAKDDTLRSVNPGAGDLARQGDIYCRHIGDTVPVGCVEVTKPSDQLAPGTSRGSRHCIGNMGEVTVYRLPNPNALQGPVIDAPEGLRVTHPEHGDIEHGPGVYLVTYQRDFAEELRRVED